MGYFAAIKIRLWEILNTYNMHTIPLRERKMLCDMYSEEYFVKKDII